MSPDPQKVAIEEIEMLFVPMTKTEQALLSFGIRVVVIALVAALDFLIKNITTIGLPDPNITVPIVGLVLSEADTWLVNWEGTQPQ
jgi:hypothetical protein